MRRLIFGSLPFLVLVLMNAPALRAEKPSNNSSDSPTLNTPSSLSDTPALDAPSSNEDITPFNLVGLAYQGLFKDQGIPSADSLITDYQTGKISALDVVKGAVEAQRLSPDFLNDSEYIAAVGNQLDGLSSGSNKR
jgi:hypothetical protein